MKTAPIINKITQIPAGQFFRIRYTTIARLKAEYENQGYSLIKIVDTTSRTGIKYSNVASNSTHAIFDLEKANSWSWVVKNRIKHNTNTGKDYLVLYPIKRGNHTVESFVLTSPDGVSQIIDKEAAHDWTIASYWGEKKPVVVNVTLENVLLIK